MPPRALCCKHDIGSSNADDRNPRNPVGSDTNAVLTVVLRGVQDDELLSAMHIPVDGEQVQVVEVSEETELVDAALTSLGGSASDEMDEVGCVAGARCESVLVGCA